MRVGLIFAGTVLVGAFAMPSAVAAPMQHHLELPMQHHSAELPKQLHPAVLPNSSYGVTWTADSASNSISEYAASAAGSASPIATVVGADTGLSSPSGVVVGPQGSIYVSNAGNDSITEYAAGASGDSAPTTTITGVLTSLDAPSSIALAEGEVWVTDPASDLVEAFTAGSTGDELPAQTIAGPKTGLNNPIALAGNDQAGQISVLNVPASGVRTVTAYNLGDAGDVSPAARIPLPKAKLAEPSAIAADGLGLIWVADSAGDSVSEYFGLLAFLDSSPINTIKGPDTDLDGPTALSVNPLDQLEVANSGDNTVRVFGINAHKDSAPIRTISGVGAASAIVSFGAAPSAPQHFTVVGHSSSATMSWQPPSLTGGGILAYEVLALPASEILGGPSGPVDGTGGEHVTRKTTFTQHHLIDGQTYLFEVAAVNGDGGSAGPAKFATPRSVPTAPRALHALGGTDSIALIWSSPKNDGGSRILSYRVEYATCSPAAKGCAFHSRHIGGFRRHVDIGGLTPGTTYHLRVIAHSKIGNSRPTRVIRVRTT